MSVKIDSMGATTLSRITGVSISVPNTTQLAITTQRVKTILGQLFTLAFNGIVPTGYSWSTILTNSVTTSNPSNITIRGSEIRLGGASTTVKMLGNTINVDATFPTFLAGIQNTGKIQAGYVTVPAGTTLLVPPTIVGGVQSIFLTGTVNGTVGVNGNTGSGFNIVSSVPQEINWVFIN